MKAIRYRLFLIILSVCFTASSHSQEILSFAEQMPAAEYKLSEFLSENLMYPPVAREQGVEGKVLVKFVVDSNGNITNPKVLRSVHPALDSESIRVVSMMPKWKPGKQGGKEVNVYFTIPIKFELAPAKTPLPVNDTQLVLPKLAFGYKTYIDSFIKYPKKGVLSLYEDTVSFKFTIDKAGKLTNVKIIKPAYADFIDEVKRVLLSMPAWEPGTVNGQVTCMAFQASILFFIENMIDYVDVVREGKYDMGRGFFCTVNPPYFIGYDLDCK